MLLTPGSELKMQTQKVEEAAGKILEQSLVNTDPFSGNKCKDKNCLHNPNPKNRINSRRNYICNKITCSICLKAGLSGKVASSYFGESGKNMHCVYLFIPSPVREGSNLFGDCRGSIFSNRAETNQEG